MSQKGQPPIPTPTPSTPSPPSQARLCKKCSLPSHSTSSGVHLEGQIQGFLAHRRLGANHRKFDSCRTPPGRPGDFSSLENTEMTTNETDSAAGIGRKRCRNLRCRMKLPVPTDNEHHAFCTPGCHAGFYRARCLVCEDSMKRKREGQKLKSGHGRCAAEYRKFPRAYDYPRAENAEKGADSQIANESLGNPHEMGTFSGIAGKR